MVVAIDLPVYYPDPAVYHLAQVKYHLAQVNYRLPLVMYRLPQLKYRPLQMNYHSVLVLYLLDRIQRDQHLLKHLDHQLSHRLLWPKKHQRHRKQFIGIELTLAFSL